MEGSIDWKELLKETGRWNVGIDSKVNICEDKWLSTGNKAFMKVNATARDVNHWE